MEKREQTITMTYADFEELVREEVRKQTKGNKINPRELFPSSSQISDDIRSINKKHPNLFKSDYEKKVKELVNRNTRIEMGIERSPLGGTVRKEFMKTPAEIDDEAMKEFETWKIYDRRGKLYESDIHDLIRKLSLAVHGMTRNNQARSEEYDDLNKAYNSFKEMFIQLYRDRMDNLDR